MVIEAIRIEAARALAFIGDSRAIPYLFQLLNEDSMILDYWANEGLDRMGVGMIYVQPSGLTFPNPNPPGDHHQHADPKPYKK